MSLPTPHYELARITEYGRCEDVEIYPLSEPPLEMRLDRRGFLQAGLSAAAVLAALSGACAKAAPKAGGIPVTTAEGAGHNPICGDEVAHKGAVRTLAVSPDGATLASAGLDREIKLWSLPAGALRATLPDAYKEGLALAFSDGEILLAIDPRGLRRWQLTEDGAQPQDAEVLGTGESFLAMSSDGGTLAVLTPALEVEVRSLAGGKPFQGLALRQSNQTLALSGNGSVLAADSGSSSILLLEPAQGRRRALTAKGTVRRSLALDARGHWLAAGDNLGRVQVWPLSRDESRGRSLQYPGRPVGPLAFSPDGTMLATGDADGGITLWRLPDGRRTKSLLGSLGAVRALAFSPDGSLLASGTKDGVIQLWSLPDGEPRACLIDLKVSPSSSKGNRYEVRTASGRVVTYTAPCGTPIPPGATCTCNCVPGTIHIPPPQPRSSSPGGWGGTVCTCNQVCVCIPVG